MPGSSATAGGPSLRNRSVELRRMLLDSRFASALGDLRDMETLLEMAEEQLLSELGASTISETGNVHEWSYRGSRVSPSDAGALCREALQSDDDERETPRKSRLRALLAVLDGAMKDVQEASAALRDQESEWERLGKWPRYFRVPRGRLHSQPACPARRGHTKPRLVIDLGGKYPDEVVRLVDARLCTRCFPQESTGRGAAQA